MKYALRKLIAFVFLGGLFWFIYQDLDNLDKPWFLHALGLLVILFAFIWLLVPMVVVALRIHRRRRQNALRYDAWRSTRAGSPPAPLASAGLRIALAADETAYWHEKGTLYATRFPPAGAWPSRGTPSDVAFPHFGRARYLQRTHVYLTDRRVLFSGKGLSLSLPLEAVDSVELAPGGLIFAARVGTDRPRFAFTFRNPLVVRDIYSYITSHDRKNP